MHVQRITGLALISLVLSAPGCYYRVENYGYTREFGIGKVGCQVASPKRGPAPVAELHGLPSQCEHVVAVLPDESAANVVTPAAKPAPILNGLPGEVAIESAMEPPASALPKLRQDLSVPRWQDVMAPLVNLLPKLSPPAAGTLRLNRPLPPPPEKGWVGLPAF